MAAGMQVDHQAVDRSRRDMQDVGTGQAAEVDVSPREGLGHRRGGKDAQGSRQRARATGYRMQSHTVSPTPPWHTFRDANC
ncbi:hypothetical protein MMUR_25810 [Mycolicibacterium murale]|uniref:Uncharacterized protein n=1 Tax=Mycolicibacterium murale TaxID=182220 RepID=A0A7I9WL21_9MYCO|nr:hypothetical protein MMUR_25810 [Mycolicibacterium murale]